ncbi:uncharacterized protein LOC122278844 isoform X2 [Carya illinoinensis]|uniref:uncharacterized protein LOC122278844 isoform X2 n=1 Tax=Carya illinoinensis TaxID=32201 RepID=UPI001C726F7E|nr:uncharacterized protein LOC122278844 isoform X2 [Carya illinoinensis]
MGGIEISFWRDLRGKAIGWLILSLRSPNQRLRKRRSLRRKRLPSLKRRKKSAVEFKHELGEGEERASTTRTPSQLLVPDLTVDIKNQMSEKRKKWEKKLLGGKFRANGVRRRPRWKSPETLRSFLTFTSELVAVKLPIAIAWQSKYSLN